MYEPNIVVERYPLISAELLQKEIDDIVETINEFFCVAEYPDDTEFDVSYYSLAEIIIRIDKRSVYYQYFHNGTHINERKQAALLAYWVLKFRPICLKDVRYKNEEDELKINELFACYIIESILRESDPAFDAASHKEVQGKTFFDRLLYSFRYQCYTIDSLMMVVETMTPQIYSIEYSDVSDLA